MVEAIGHTIGKGIFITKDDELFCISLGYVAYTDVVLYANSLTVVFEYIQKARETLDNVRWFVKNQPKVHLSTPNISTDYLFLIASYESDDDQIHPHERYINPNIKISKIMKNNKILINFYNLKK